VIEYTLISADGVYDDPDPVTMGFRDYQDEAYLRDELGLFSACEAMLFGRSTYEVFAKLWSGSARLDGDDRGRPTEMVAMKADRINAIPKYVFSSTLEEAQWSNSTIVRGDPVTEVSRLKQQTGGDLLILGHGLLEETLLRERLIDVITLAIHPLLVGRGRQFFREREDLRLQLAAATTFSKIVKLTYEVQR
jgi:dihydrofolate reductase